jgi:hypothetical protein
VERVHCPRATDPIEQSELFCFPRPGMPAKTPILPGARIELKRIRPKNAEFSLTECTLSNEHGGKMNLLCDYYVTHSG